MQPEEDNENDISNASIESIEKDNFFKLYFKRG